MPSLKNISRLFYKDIETFKAHILPFYEKEAGRKFTEQEIIDLFLDTGAKENLLQNGNNRKSVSGSAQSD